MIKNSALNFAEKASYTMSSIYFESNGHALESQPEFLGEYGLDHRHPDKLLQRRKRISPSYHVRVRSYQFSQEDESPVYYQKGGSGNTVFSLKQAELGVPHSEIQVELD